MALRTYLTGIADAIREKKGTSDPINAQDFASEIASISTGGDGDNLLQTLINGKGVDGGYSLFSKYQGTTIDFLNDLDFSNTTSMSNMFDYCKNLTTIPFLNTSQVIDMSYMFNGCTKLNTIPLLDTSKVTKMNYMFSYCYGLTTIPQLDLSSVTNTTGMFSSDAKLVSVPLLDTSNVTSMGTMFNGCYNLTTIDITKLANGATNFAANCSRLTKLIIRTIDTIPTFGSNMLRNCYHMSGTVDTTSNPDGLQDGRIYVPDDKVDALKTATGWSEFADIIVPLSTLVED